MVLQSCAIVHGHSNFQAAVNTHDPKDVCASMHWRQYCAAQDFLLHFHASLQSMTWLYFDDNSLMTTFCWVMLQWKRVWWDCKYQGFHSENTAHASEFPSTFKTLMKQHSKHCWNKPGYFLHVNLKRFVHLHDLMHMMLHNQLACLGLQVQVQAKG